MNRRDFILAAATSALLLPATSRSAVSHKDLSAGDTLQFDYRILFGDSDIGHHRVSITKDPSGLISVEHERRMEIRLLFVRVYAFQQRSRELWDGQSLKRLDADGEENGKGFVVQGREVEGEGFAVSGPQGDLLGPQDLATTESFWVSSTLNKPHLLDTVKGKVVKPRVERLDDGRWHLEHGDIQADIRFDGDFMSDADVDNDGHSVRFVRVAS